MRSVRDERVMSLGFGTTVVGIPSRRVAESQAKKVWSGLVLRARVPFQVTTDRSPAYTQHCNERVRGKTYAAHATPGPLHHAPTIRDRLPRLRTTKYFLD